MQMRIPALISGAMFALCAAPAAMAQTGSPNSAQIAPNIEPAAITRELRLRKSPRLSDFTGLPVPRYASLKYNKVNGRAGPGFDYPVRWTYERAGLPVLVLRESPEWIKIRDPEGDEVWVAKHMLGARRTGMTAANTRIFASPDPASRIIAEVDIGVVADLADCQAGWCHVRVAGHKGWLRHDALWGADDLG